MKYNICLSISTKNKQAYEFADFMHINFLVHIEVTPVFLFDMWVEIHIDIQTDIFSHIVNNR